MIPKSGADSETRTRDILIGSQVFYQLNYARVNWDAAEGNDPSPNWRMKPVSDLLKPRLLVAGGGRVELPRLGSLARRFSRPLQSPI